METFLSGTVQLYMIHGVSMVHDRLAWCFTGSKTLSKSKLIAHVSAHILGSYEM